MLNATYIVSLLGAVIFGVGLSGINSMNIRIQGRMNMFKLLPDLKSKYRRLIREEGAPMWPLIVGIWCMPLGAMISFAAILLIR
jgi:hypothetical protein